MDDYAGGEICGLMDPTSIAMPVMGIKGESRRRAQNSHFAVGHHCTVHTRRLRSSQTLVERRRQNLVILVELSTWGVQHSRSTKGDLGDSCCRFWNWRSKKIYKQKLDPFIVHPR